MPNRVEGSGRGLGLGCGFGSGGVLLALDFVFIDNGAGIGIRISKVDEVGEQFRVSSLHLLGLLDERLALFNELGEVFLGVCKRGDLPIQILCLPFHAPSVLAEAADLSKHKHSKGEGNESQWKMDIF